MQASMVFFDPLHGGCLRVIKRISVDAYKIYGVYGDDEKPDPAGNAWWATMYVLERVGDVVKFRVDFSHGKPRKRDKELSAEYHPKRRCIRWEDGNKWREMFVHQSQIFALKKKPQQKHAMQ